VVTAWNDVSASEWYVIGGGETGGGGGSFQANVSVTDNGAPSIIDCQNDNPAVAWADAGIVVLWELYDDGISSCQISDDCGGLPITANNNTINVVLKYLDHDFSYTYANEYSVFNYEMDDDLFLAPSVADGDGSGSTDVLFASYWYQGTGPDELITYKAATHGTQQLKRSETQSQEQLSQAVIVHPNPFGDAFSVRTSGLGDVLSCSITNIFGGAPPIDVQHSGDVVTVYCSGSMPPGIYKVLITGTTGTRAIRVVKAH
jgi:hypothetical protein